MAGKWKETGVSKSAIDWVPLPEVKSDRGRTGEDVSGSQSHHRYAYSSPVLSTHQPSSSNPRQPPGGEDTPLTNLTIMSLGSSSTGQTSQVIQPRPLSTTLLNDSTSTTREGVSGTKINIDSAQSSTGQTIEPRPLSTTLLNDSTSTREGVSGTGINIDSAQLDELWRKFLETVMIPREPSQHTCNCSCHVTRPRPSVPPISVNMPHPLGKPPCFSVSPPKKVLTSEKTRPELLNAEKSHSESFIPTKTQTHVHSVRNRTPLNNILLNNHDTTLTTNTQSDSETSIPSPHSHFPKEAQTSSMYIHNPTKGVLLTTPTRPNNLPSTLEKVSLQEACQLLKKGFIKRCEERQETIKRRAIHRPLLTQETAKEPMSNPPPVDTVQPFVLS